MGYPPCALNRGSPAPPPAELSCCSSAPRLPVAPLLPLRHCGLCAGSCQTLTSEELPRGPSPLSADARGQIWRVSRQSKGT